RSRGSLIGLLQQVDDLLSRLGVAEAIDEALVPVVLPDGHDGLQPVLYLVRRVDQQKYQIHRLPVERVPLDPPPREGDGTDPAITRGMVHNHIDGEGHPSTRPRRTEFLTIQPRTRA